MSFIRLVVAATLAGMLGACATSGPTYSQRMQQRQAAYATAAGAPVRSFQFFNLWSWEPLSNTQLAVYTRPNQAWLVDVEDNCQNLWFTNTIGLTANASQVQVHFDKVLTGRTYIPCTIMQIRPVDLARLKVEQQAQRKIDAEQRPTEQPAQGQPSGS
jgi:hypothetical protein